jgi:hypothetical protein
MSRKLGSIGFLVLVVTMAVVLVLVARSWASLAPTATEIRAVQGGTDSPRSEASGGASRDMPDMSDMKDATDAHAGDVQEAMAAID